MGSNKHIDHSHLAGWYINLSRVINMAADALATDLAQWPVYDIAPLQIWPICITVVS